MRFAIQRFALCVAFILCTTAALAAADSKTSSAEKARQALDLLKSSAPPAEKALACKRLAVYGQSGAVPALAALLPDEQLSSWARIALEAIPGRAADEALRNALGKLHGKLLVGVINSIGERRDAKAVGGLTARLKDPDAEVSSAAARALGRIGGDRAAKALKPMLAGAPASLRSAAAQGCISCAEQFLVGKKFTQAAKLYDIVRGAGVPAQRVREATRGAILARQSRGIPLLIETLRSPDKEMFGIGLWTARELPGRNVTDALVAELGKSSPDRQGPLLLALADRHDPAALPVVLRTAQVSPKNLRLVAIDILARMGDVAGVPVLLDAVVGSDTEVAQAAKTSLAALPASEVDQQLLVRMSRASGNTRRTLIQLAGQRQVAAAVPELVKAANDSDPAISAAGIKALGETVGAAHLGALTDLLAKSKSDDDLSQIQEALESACSRITDKEACADKLLSCLPASASPARCALIRVLSVVGTANALDAVKSAIASPEAPVRDASIRTLADWPDADALPPLLDVFRGAQDESHRFLALRGCVRLLDLSTQAASEKVKTYTDLLSRTERPDDRKALLSGLGNVADPAALKLVEPFLGDDQVRAEAEAALLSVATGIKASAPAEAKAVATRLQAESKSESTRDRAAKLLAGLEKGR